MNENEALTHSQTEISIIENAVDCRWSSAILISHIKPRYIMNHTVDFDIGFRNFDRKGSEI